MEDEVEYDDDYGDDDDNWVEVEDDVKVFGWGFWREE